jgi:peptide-methionine (S)-S-oxide reductase
MSAGAWTDRGTAAEGETAIFAGGCFWCVEEAFDKVPGVLATISGYTGGEAPNPTYKQVSAGGTGHYEAVKVEYDPAQVSYEELLETFWHNIDPFDGRGQFCDKGSQYLSAIFVGSEAEQGLAEKSREAVAERFHMGVATQILSEQAFYPAEDYHQDFYRTTPAHYKFYKYGCGRAQRLEEIWGKPAA